MFRGMRRCYRLLPYFFRLVWDVGLRGGPAVLLWQTKIRGVLLTTQMNIHSGDQMRELSFGYELGDTQACFQEIDTELQGVLEEAWTILDTN